MTRSKELRTNRYTAGAGIDTIRSLHIFHTEVAASDKPPMTIVFGNGAFGGPRTLGPIVKQMLRTGAAEGQSIRAIMYRDPWLGTGIYRQDLRSERLARVVANAATEQPVHLVGHSWSWPSAVEIARAQADNIAALEGYTPTGHRSEGVFGPRAIARAALVEARQADLRIARGNVRALGLLGVSGVGRLLFSGAVAEGLESFTPDVTPRVVELRQTSTPVGMVLAEHDAFFKPATEVRNALEGAGVVIHDIPTTHLGAVMNPCYGADLFRLVQAVSP